jgi:hypothetical protein
MVVAISGGVFAPTAVRVAAQSPGAVAAPFVAPPVVPPFPLNFSTALYHRSNNVWVSTHVIRLGDKVEFVCLFRAKAPEWHNTSAHLRIVRSRGIGGQHHILQFGWRHIYRVGMRRQVLPDGYTRFSVTAVFRSSKMLGLLKALFHITSGVQAAEPGLDFTVTRR